MLICAVAQTTTALSCASMASPIEPSKPKKSIFFLGPSLEPRLFIELRYG
jgi:hypothetical protein